MPWPESLPAGGVRFARPTARLRACVEFYRDLLGLRVLAEFHDHDGYDGFVFGLPDSATQLELTSQAHAPAPHPLSAEDQLVFYLPGAGEVGRVEARLRAHGLLPIRTENPYWNDRGAIAFRDPDGLVVIFAPS